jgi:hypothetical protein
MTEHDAFEARFHAAIRGYVGSVSSELDPGSLAHRIAEGEPRRHGFPAVVGWRGIAIPRAAWALLLLAGLLAAMVGGMLFVGSHGEPKLPAVVPPVGQVFECPPASTPDEPGPADQARPPEPDMAMAFDRSAGKLVAVANAGDVETWTFDVCTNTWTRMHPDREPDGMNGWDRAVYDIDSQVTIAVNRSTGKVWAYDLQADTWTEKGLAPPYARPWAYDPISGLVVAASSGVAEPTAIFLWNYDVETDTWTPIQQANGPRPSEGVIAYDASVDRIVAYATGAAGFETWLFDVRTGTWSRSRSSAETLGVVAGLGPPRIEYDEAAKRTVIMSNAGAAAYDASANRWEYVVTREPGWMTATMVYDPVNERLVGPGPYVNAEGVHLDRAGVVAFDPGTREWTVLLEGDGGRPAP